jgi:hypothetical protein
MTENRMESHLNREELHILLDRIPDSDIATARKILARWPTPYNWRCSTRRPTMNHSPRTSKPRRIPTSAAVRPVRPPFRTRNS